MRPHSHKIGIKKLRLFHKRKALVLTLSTPGTGRSNLYRRQGWRPPLIENIRLIKKPPFGGYLSIGLNLYLHV